MNNNLVRLNTNNLSVGILGYTGETGKYLTRYILESRLFKNVVLIGRRHVQYQEEIYNNAVNKLLIIIIIIIILLIETILKRFIFNN